MSTSQFKGNTHHSVFPVCVIHLHLQAIWQTFLLSSCYSPLGRLIYRKPLGEWKGHFTHNAFARHRIQQQFCMEPSGPVIVGGRQEESHSWPYLQLSTNALASSSRESGRTAVVKSVMLKKCFSRPMNVVWSHRGASISNERPAMMVLFTAPPPPSSWCLNSYWTPGEQKCKCSATTNKYRS